MMPKSTATSRPCGVDEQIARMHVGVEEAVAQRMAQEALDHRAAERRQVEARGGERRAVVQRRAVDPFERQHVAARCGPSRPRARGSRHRRVVFSAISESAAASSRRSISIATERRQRVDHLDAAAAAAPPAEAPRRCGRRSRKLSRSRGETRARRRAAGSSPRPLAAPRGVATSARCTCAIEAAATGGAEGDEQIVDGWPIEAPRRSPRRRACGTAPSCPAALEIARDVGADDIGPRRQELAELDVGRPEPVQRRRQPSPRPSLRAAAARSAAPARAAAWAARRQRRGSTQREARPRARARSRRAPGGPRWQIAREACGDHQSFQPECSAAMPPVMLRER